MRTDGEERNKELVLEAFETLFNRKDYDKAAEYWSEDYIQHSALVPAGRDGLFNEARSLPGLRFEYDMIVAEGDFVWLHSRYSNHGKTAALIAVDILRIEGGKLVEHWDVLQNEVTREQSAGGYPMFGDSFPESMKK